MEEKRAEYEAGLKSLSNEHAKRAKRFIEEALVSVRKASEHSKGMPYKDAIDKADALLVAALAQVKVTPIL